MQISSLSSGPAMPAPAPRAEAPVDPAFQPITKEDLTLTGITRRILAMNLGHSIDLQA